MLPLGGLDRRVPRLPGSPCEPDAAALLPLCNLGYARGACPLFPGADGPDAVRFTISQESGSVVRLYYVLERDHHPFPHGPLEFAGARAFTDPPADERLRARPGPTSRATCAGKRKPLCVDAHQERQDMEGKPVRESISEYSELALPNDANGLGNVLGGKVMHLVDLAAAMAAIRHARRPVVTASVDSLHFLHPVHIGQLIVLRSSVNRVFRTSMEVGVKVETETLMTGEKLHTCSAYLTFVALDENGKATAIPPVIPETERNCGDIAKPENAGIPSGACGTG